MKRMSWTGMMVGIGLLFAGSAGAVPVDLGTFAADPSVVVAAGGAKAVFSEDPSLWSVTLVGNPFVVPSDATSLSFDYDLLVADANEDYVHAFLFDPGSGDPLSAFALEDGGVSGHYTNHIIWDLTGAGFLGQELGLAFDLAAGWNDGGYDSVLSISNVDLARPAAPVPEPATLVLLSSGLAGLVGWRRRGTHSDLERGERGER